MSGRKLFGRATIKLDGKTVETSDGASFNPGGPDRSTVVGSNAINYSEKLAPSKVDCEVMFGAGDRLSDFDLAGISIHFVTDTGQTYVIASAWRVGTPDLSEGGKLKLSFEGVPAQEMIV